MIWINDSFREIKNQYQYRNIADDEIPQVQFVPENMSPY